MAVASLYVNVIKLLDVLRPVHYLMIKKTRNSLLRLHCAAQSLVCL